MNAASSNAFLKTLEEPPGDALIILITAMPQSLLATIRSRCQEIMFHPLPRNVLARALVQPAWTCPKKTHGLSRRLRREAWAAVLRWTLSREKAAREEVATLWSGLAQMGPGEALALAETLAKDRERLERLIEIGVEWLRDALVYRVDRGRAPARPCTRHNSCPVRWPNEYSLPRLLADMDLFMASRNLLDRRVSAQLVTENLLLKFGRG